MPAKKDDQAQVVKEKKVEEKATKKVDPKHGAYYNDVEVKCICGATFTINATVPGPVKVETCHKCHPIYNKDKAVKQVIKGRMEKFLEKQKRMEAMKK